MTPAKRNRELRSWTIACAIALMPLPGAPSTKDKLLHLLEQAAPHLSDAGKVPDTTRLSPYYHPELIAQIQKGYARPTHCGSFDPLTCSPDSEIRLLRTVSFTVKEERMRVACLGVRQAEKTRAQILVFARFDESWRLLAAADPARYFPAGKQIAWQNLLDHCPRATSKWDQGPLERPYPGLNSARYSLIGAPGATRTVTDSTGWKFDVAIGTDGRFTFDGLPGGSYEIRAGSDKHHIMLHTLAVPSAPVRGE